MKQLLCIFFSLAILPATAIKAAPFAEYNPATGDIALKELGGVAEFQLNSKNGLLNKTIVAQPPIYLPSMAPAPVISDAYINGPGYILRWTPSLGEPQFKFQTLTVLHAVPPLTPHVNELQFSARIFGERLSVLRELRVVPEPTTFALAGAALIGLAALRRRK